MPNAPFTGIVDLDEDDDDSFGHSGHGGGGGQGMGRGGRVREAAAKRDDDPCAATPPTILSYPVTLSTVVIDGPPLPMPLPSGPLPVPKSLPSVEKMLSVTPDALRNVAFELCGKKEGTIMARARNQLPSCGWYFEKYADSWGGKPFINVMLMRDDDDEGEPNPDKDRFMPLINFKKDGLFNPAKPLFKNMVAGNYEEWTIINRSYSDHPFHIHQNPFLVTEINGKKLDIPEWHDTINVPGTRKQPTNFLPPPHQPNINKIKHGSITFRIYFDPITVGCLLMHCHIINHEDMGMMQRLDILPGRNQPSGCPDMATMDH
jgi:FtsP/CotA-like multicopper oxidase with cupredoxin domain